MADARDTTHIVASFINTTVWAVVAYCHYGTIANRSTWDRQHLWLPLLFLIFPEIFACQILINTMLLVQRFFGMRRLNPPVPMHQEGFWFYLGGVLDLHSSSRDFGAHNVWINDHWQKSEGNWRLSTLNPSRLSFINKYRAGTRRQAKTFSYARTFVVLVCLYQGVSAAITYVVRVRSVENGMLSIDHLTGLYAICGTLVELATLVVIAQPYEWSDDNRFIEREREAMPDVNTSNAWVYEGFLAVMLHGCLCVSYRLSVFISTLNSQKEGAPAAKRGTDLFFILFPGPGIAVLGMVVVIFLPLMLPTLWEITFRPYRDGLVWLARLFNIGYEAGGRSFRLLLLALSTALTAMVWAVVGEEIMRLQRGKTEPWNQNWRTPNPTSDTIWGVVLSLWS